MFISTVLRYQPLKRLVKTNHWSISCYRVSFKSFISCIVGYLLYHLYHAFLRVHILTCGYISVCVHIDGFAQNCGSSSANTMELPRSCIWPGMFSVYDLVYGCVGVILFIVFACFIYFIVGQ